MKENYWLGTEPAFPDNFTIELEAQIKYYRDLCEWTSLQDPEVLFSNVFNIRLFACATVLGMSFLQLIKEGGVPPYEGVDDLKLWWDETGGIRNLLDNRDELTKRTLMFFRDTFGAEVIEC